MGALKRRTQAGYCPSAVWLGGGYKGQGCRPPEMAISKWHFERAVGAQQALLCSRFCEEREQGQGNQAGRLSTKSYCGCRVTDGGGGERTFNAFPFVQSLPALRGGGAGLTHHKPRPDRA